MPLTMTYDQWMKDTHSIIKPRSESLKRIDAAIRLRNETDTKKALVSWINEQNTKRQDWHKSVRNEKGAVKKLYDQLGVLGAGATFKSPQEQRADIVARQEMKENMRQAAANMFRGREMKFKDSFWGITRSRCNTITTKLERVENGARTGVGVARKVYAVGSPLYSIAQNLEKAIKGIMGEGLPEATRNEIIAAVLGTSIADFAKDSSPLIGVFSSGAKAAAAWVGVATNVYDQTVMEENFGNVRPGDAASALRAISAIIERQIAKQTVDAVVRTTAFTAKGLTVLADGGTATTAAIGAVESIAILLNTLADIVTDARQKIAANKLIEAGKIDVELFNVCPMLGCYYIVVQDHSTIMNFDVENMGRDNWQQEAERLRWALQPVLEKAKTLIASSRIELPGMDIAKGVYQSTFLQKLTLAYKNF